MLGRVGKAFGSMDRGIKTGIRRGAYGAGRAMGSRQASTIFDAMGKRSLTGAARIASGRRRMMYGGAAMGAGLGINAVLGPKAGNSTGGRGYQYPRSTGGYA